MCNLFGILPARAHSRRSTRRQIAKKVAHKTDIRGQAGYWADILGQKITDSQSHRCTHADFVCETLLGDPPTQIQSWRSARRQNAKKVAHKTDIRGQAGYWADILRQKITDSRSHWCTHANFVCETLLGDPPTQIQSWRSVRRQNAKKVAHKTDIRGQAGYWADTLRQKITDSRSHRCTHADFVCETLLGDPPTQIQSWRSARRQNAKNVAHKTDIRGQAGYCVDILLQKITDSQSHRCTHANFVCETLFSRPSHSNQSWQGARRQNAKNVAHKTDIRGQAGYCADIICQKIADARSHRCSHDDFVCETLFSRPSHSNSIVTERAQAECQRGGTQDWY